MYRLDKYVIADYGTGQFWWESHVALGEQRGGKCFVCGDVLIIGEWSHEENGYLVDKFFEQLEKLPLWDKTRYYCLISDLLDVDTGQNLTNILLEKRLSPLSTKSAGLKPADRLKPGEFRLGPYRITVAGNDIFWRACGELNRTVGGKCVIRSDILFIGGQTEDKEACSKQEFIKELHLLPPWDRTIAWSRGQVLRVCRQEKQKERPGIRDTWSDRTTNKKQAAQYLAHHKEASKKLLMSVLLRLKIAWHRAFAGKVWIRYIVPLVAAALLLVLAMTLYPLKRMFHWAHWRKEHHHKHEDHDR